MKLASLTALLAAPARKRDRNSGAVIANPQSLAALEPETLGLLRRLALRSLEVLGVRESEKFVQEEMLVQFDRLARGLGTGVETEARLRVAINAALDQLDD